MNIELILARLIAENQTAILPGFGIFTATATEFYIHPVENSFSPPSLKLEFSYDGKCTSDLFVSSLATTLEIEIAESERKIEEFVKDLKINIQRGNTAKIYGIGEFYLTTRKTINFRQAIEFSLSQDSFGMKSFKINPVKRESEPVKAATPIIAESKKKSGSLNKFLPYAAILLLIGGAATAYFLIFNQKTNLVEISENNPKTDTIIPQNQDIQTIADTISQDSTLVDSTVITETQHPVENAIAADGSKKYFIVAGCFMSETLATNFVEKLKSKGYPASIEGKTSSGLFRVCYDGYPTWKDAELAVREINKKEGKSLWIDKVY